MLVTHTLTHFLPLFSFPGWFVSSWSEEQTTTPETRHRKTPYPSPWTPPTLTSSLCECLSQQQNDKWRYKLYNNISFSNCSAPLQAADRQNEQGDAGDGRSVWPIRSLGGAWVWGFNWRDRWWAGSHQKGPTGDKEPYKWLGSGGA